MIGLRQIGTDRYIAGESKTILFNCGGEKL
jgi:hypothetical protein